MKIIITADEAINLGLWAKLCEVKGLNPWAISEGIIVGHYEITLTEEEANKIGLHIKKE